MSAVLRWICFALLATWSLQAFAQQTPITRYTRLTGNINFIATGGSLRTSASDACAVGATSSESLAGIPAGASIVAAYLYWGGSGAAIDSSVTLNGSGVTASRTFQAVYDNAGTDLPFFGGFADVTTRVTGNGTYTFGGLTVNTGAPHCGVAAVQAGWGLIAIYGSPSERLRAINVFDGLQYFRGSSLTLTPNGFRIPATNIDGRFAVITWEGDPANSDPLNGFAEALRFNGSLLDDGIVAPGSNPAVQQFDGTVNSLGVDDSYGADIDTYDISALLAPGQTSASTQYSAGGDLVMLTAQIVSVTSEPIVDLGLTKTHAGDFSVGTNMAYTLTVRSESGSQQTDFPITVTDTLPAGLTYVSASGSGWSCGASGQVVTCTHGGPLNAGASLPAITLNVAVGNAAFPSVSNTAQVTTPSNDPDAANNSATDVATVLGPNLSTSTKTVQDLNGGDANPGDTLRYTITINESAGVAALNAAITDDVPANVAGFSVASIPPGATNASTGAGTGANGTGYLNITGVNVPANGSATVTFDVQVTAGASPGTTIDNTATIDNAAGVDATPSAPQIVVSQSQIPGSGTKPLYLWSAPSRLYRTPPSSGQPSITINGQGDSEIWTLSPTLTLPVTLAAGPFSALLWVSRSGSAVQSRNIEVTFGNTALGTIATATLTTNLSTSAALRTFAFTLPASITAPTGSAFTLTVTNDTAGGGGNRRLVVHPFPSPGNFSRLELNSLSVINVDSVQTYNAVYPGGVLTTTFSRGATAYVRAVVSDPFGSFDIAGANVTILDPASGVQIDNAVMTEVDDSGAATVTYEYAFAVPAAAATGSWTARVTAREGTENTVTDAGVGSFTIAAPALQVLKTSQVLSDPINAVNPKSIPGAVQLYTVRTTNQGDGAVDSDSLIITDAIPANTAMYVLDVDGVGSGPVAFIDGAPTTTLTYTFTALNNSTDDLEFSSNGGASWNYAPTPDADGYDAAVTHIRVRPQGSMAASSGGDPWFEIRFRVRVN
ncbi:MAG: hypothetical protein ACREV5_15000 [Steroidobacter sp.]